MRSKPSSDPLWWLHHQTLVSANHCAAPAGVSTQARDYPGRAISGHPIVGIMRARRWPVFAVRGSAAPAPSSGPKAPRRRSDKFLIADERVLLNGRPSRDALSLRAAGPAEGCRPGTPEFRLTAAAPPARPGRTINCNQASAPAPRCGERTASNSPCELWRCG